MTLTRRWWNGLAGAVTVSISSFLVPLASPSAVAHAAEGGKMEALCRDILATGTPLYTFDHPANEALLAAGAKSVAELEAGGYYT